jgi:hypothetical protein
MRICVKSTSSLTIIIALNITTRDTSDLFAKPPIFFHLRYQLETWIHGFYFNQIVFSNAFGENPSC